MPERSYRRAIVVEEQLVVVDTPARLEMSIECELTLQDCDRSGTELDNPVLVGLRRVVIDAINSRLSDGQGGCLCIEILHLKRNFLRRTKASEKAELMEVALRFAPVPTDRDNQCFRILDAERIDPQSVAATNTRAF